MNYLSIISSNRISVESGFFGQQAISSPFDIEQQHCFGQLILGLLESAFFWERQAISLPFDIEQRDSFRPLILCLGQLILGLLESGFFGSDNQLAYLLILSSNMVSDS